MDFVCNKRGYAVRESCNKRGFTVYLFQRALRKKLIPERPLFVAKRVFAANTDALTSNMSKFASDGICT